MAEGRGKNVLRMLSDSESAIVLARLVEAGKVLPETISREIERLRRETGKVAMQQVCVKKGGDVVVIKEKVLSPEKCDEILDTLEARFKSGKRIRLKKPISWNRVEKRLRQNQEKIWTLYMMESTGGEPEFCGYEKRSDRFAFVDLADKCPRTCVCYNKQGQEEAEKNGYRPLGNAIDMAYTMGVELWSFSEYERIVALTAEFGCLPILDNDTRCWLNTTDEKSSGGMANVGVTLPFMNARCCEDHVSSYNDKLGFRGWLCV